MTPIQNNLSCSIFFLFFFLGQFILNMYGQYLTANYYTLSLLFLKQNVILEAVNQVLDPSLDEISNNNLNSAGATNKSVAAGAENADLTEETEAKREKFTCRICEENEAVVALKPCGHIVLCTGI